MKKVKLLLTVFTFVIILLIGQGIALASYTVYDSGYKGVWSVRDSDTGHTYTNPLITAGMDSIVSVTLRYKRVSGQNVSCTMRAATAMNQYGYTEYITSIVDTSWSSPVTFSIPDGGFNGFAFYGYTTTTTDATILQIEILNIQYKRYSIDSTDLTLESDGYIHVSYVNSTPNGFIQYTFKNNQTAAVKNDTIEWIDTSVGVGKSYSYTLQWGFYPNKVNVVNMGSVYIPIDPDLTNRVNTVIEDVSNGYGNTINAVRDASGTVLSEARQAKTNSLTASTNALNAYNTAQTVNTKIDTLSTAVTNIQNNMGADASPPEIQIATVSGALATSGNYIRAVINASDNLSTLFEYSLDGTAYQPLTQDGVVELPVSSPGANLITVWVKDEAGNVGRNSITIRKL